MKRHLPLHPKPLCPRCIKWFSINVILLTLLIAVATFYLFPIKVLTSWTTTVPESQVKTGQTIHFVAKYKKHFDAPAASERYLQCIGPGGLTEYPVSFTYPTTKPGVYSRTTALTVPTIPQGLPTKCRLHFRVSYLLWKVSFGPVSFGKPVEQENYSNWFTVTS